MNNEIDRLSYRTNIFGETFFTFLKENIFHLQDRRKSFIRKCNVFEISNSPIRFINGPDHDWCKQVYSHFTNFFRCHGYVATITEKAYMKVRATKVCSAENLDDNECGDDTDSQIASNSQHKNTQALTDKKTQILEAGSGILTTPTITIGSINFDISEEESFYKTLADEQRNTLNNILQDKEKFSIYNITGQAGCGKSRIVYGIHLHTIKRKNVESLLYVAHTNVLCQSINRNRLSRTRLETLTLCKFFTTVFKQSFFNIRPLLSILDAIPLDAFASVLGEGFLRSELHMPLAIDVKPPKVLYVILDEIYMLSEGVVSFFIFILRKIQEQTINMRVILVLIGDKHQLRPFQQPGSVKYNNIDPTIPSATECLKIEQIKNIECESAWKKVVFTKQHRITDSAYNSLLQELLKPQIQGEEFYNLLKKRYGQKYLSNLSIVYPLEEILKRIGHLTTNDAIVEELLKDNFLESILNVNVFCFTNEHAHYYNIALGASILDQICKSSYEKRRVYVKFTLFYDTKKPPQINEIQANRPYVNLLPLIRFYPYKLLEVSDIPIKCARLSIVYIIGWILNSREKIDHLIVYSKDVQKLFTLRPTKFRMNLYKDQLLLGFPLQLAFSSTFQSSQGLTITNKIALSMNNVSKEECYVTLSRIRFAEDLIAFY